MSTPLSLDPRVRGLAALATGLSHQQVGVRFGVSSASAGRWRALAGDGGDSRPKPMGGDQRTRRIEARGDLILAPYGAERGITLRELRAALARRGGSVGYGGLWRFFRRRAITVEQRRRARPMLREAQQDRPDVLRQREVWFEDQLDLDPDRLVFTHETWASAAMARTRGRAPRGQRLRAAIPRGHWTTTTFIAGRTGSALGTRIGTLLDAFTPGGCANHFAAAGYDATGTDPALAPYSARGSQGVGVSRP